MKKMERAGISEANLIIYALKNGWEVAKPIHHSQSYDFVVKINGLWKTVQVKSGFWGKSGIKPCHMVNLRRCDARGAKNYKDGDFDFLFIFVDEKCWLIPWKEIKNIRSGLYIGSSKYDKFRI